jgi:demethylmenaquinone methyltransferase/2-methoxy-6-polyprenyl-1,4-benzoquinol methylase
MKQEFFDWKRDCLTNVHNRLDKKTRIRSMFSHIADNYDFMNRLLSLNFDRKWRDKAAECLDLPDEYSLLDLCCGTGDFLFSILRRYRNCGQAIGLDFVPAMLNIARSKTQKFLLNYGDNISDNCKPTWLCGDAESLPFTDNSFDCVCCAFGLRNLQKPQQALDEIRRVLKPGGKLLLLEFCTPQNSTLSFLYQCYLRIIIPWIGELLVKNSPCAYHYLSASIKEYLSPQELWAMIENRNFSIATGKSLGLGAVQVHLAVKI